jgi:hypothetical protein
MVDSNWAEIADKRINDKLDFDKIHSKEDYESALRTLLESTHYGRNILKAGTKGKNKGIITYSDIRDEMFNSNGTQKLITSAIRQDEQKTHRKGLKRRKRGELPESMYRITNSDLSLIGKGIKTILNSRTGIKQYKDIKTGRFVKKP